MAEETFENVGDIFERLHGDARMHPVPEHVMDVKTKEGLAEARQLVNHAIAEGWTTAAALCRRTGLKGSAISAFRNDKWGKGSPGTLATTASILARAINQIVREREAKDTEVGGFVTTRLAQAIFDLAQYVIKRKMIGAFVVGAGMGKTMAIDALVLDTPGAVKVTVTRRRSAVKPFLEVLARALSLSEAGRAEDIQDRITEFIEGSGRAIFIDEAHKLSVASLDVVREIWDTARVPILLAATPALQTTLTMRRIGTVTNELMDQLYSRIGVFRDLRMLENPETQEPERVVTVDDIRKMFARGRVRLARDGASFLCRLANVPGEGGLRLCGMIVQLIVDLYPEEEITAPLLREALSMRLGSRGAGLLIDTVEVSEPRPAVAVG